MELEKLKILCTQWKGGSEGFAQIVAATDSLGMGLSDLSQEFEVAQSTVSRWANGLAKPLPRMQKMIVSWINKRVTKSLKSQGGGIGSSSNYPMAAKSRT